MKFLKHYIDFTNRFNEIIGSATSWLCSVMVLVVCYDVFARYVLKKSSVAVQEIEWHLFAVIFLVGAAYTLKHDKHVRVDIIYTKLPLKARAWINFLGSLLFLIPFAALIIWSSRHFVINSFLIKEISSDPGGLPGRFILKAIIPFGSILLFMQAFGIMFKSLDVIFGDKHNNSV